MMATATSIPDIRSCVMRDGQVLQAKHMKLTLPMPRLWAGTMAQKRPQPTNDEFAKQGGFASAVCSIKI